jgi:hypothetical protein
MMSVALVAPRAAYAADARVQQDLEQAEQALVNLDYDNANKVASRVVQQRGLSHEQLVRAYRVVAITDAVLDKESASRDAFQQLLTYDPNYQGDSNLGPKVQAPFMEARGYLRAQAQQPGVEVSVQLRPSEAGTIRVTMRDPTHLVKRIAVSYRWGGEGIFTTTPVQAAEGTSVEVPPPPSGTTRLDYYVQALDDRDGAVFESGNASVPKSATVDMSGAFAASRGGGSGAPVAEHHASALPWVLTGLGVLVVGGIVTGIVVATNKSSTGPSTGVDLSPNLQCSYAGAKCNP